MEIPATPESQVKKVTSENFTQYLVDRVDFDEKEIDDNFDLGNFNSVLRETYEQKMEGPVHTDKNYKTLLSSEERLRAAGLNEMGDKVHEQATMKAEAERTRTIYYDANTNSIEASDIIHGSLASVENQSIPLLLDDKLPLISIHTHPNNDFHSPQDFSDFLLSGI